jgi:hypothetical protein
MDSLSIALGEVISEEGEVPSWPLLSLRKSNAFHHDTVIQIDC